MAREQYQKEIETLKEQVECLECPEDRTVQAIEKSKVWEKQFEEYRHAEEVSRELSQPSWTRFRCGQTVPSKSHSSLIMS